MNNSLLLFLVCISIMPIVLGIYYIRLDKNPIIGLLILAILIIDQVAISLESVGMWLGGMFGLSVVIFGIVIYLLFQISKSTQLENNEINKIPGAIP